jgi:hypothetical protein
MAQEQQAGARSAIALVQLRFRDDDSKPLYAIAIPP